MASYTQQEVISLAHERYNGFYCYASTCYTKSTSKITIRCPVYGEFSQLAANHLRSRECRKWSDTRWFRKNIDIIEIWESDYKVALKEKKIG